MMKLIAILMLSGQLQVAVEQPSGYAEASFENSPAGAQNVIEFAERSVGNAPDGVRIVVGWIDEKSDEHILRALDDLGISHGFAMPSDIYAAMSEYNLQEPSARAVALADEKKWGFMYRKRK
jgi:hypothetical protein